MSIKLLKPTTPGQRGMSKFRLRGNHHGHA